MTNWVNSINFPGLPVKNAPILADNLLLGDNATSPAGQPSQSSINNVLNAGSQGVLISTLTGTSAAFSFQNLPQAPIYYGYTIILSGIKPTTVVTSLQLTLGYGGGPTWITTGYGGVSLAYSSSVVTPGACPSTFISLTPTNAQDNTEPLCAIINLYGTNSSNPQMTGKIGYGATGAFYGAELTSIITTTFAITAVNLAYNAGNINGTAAIYGVVHS